MSEQNSLDSSSNSNDAAKVEVEASERHRWVPSPLTRLDGSAFKAGVDDHRVAYEGANRGSPCDMSMEELQSLANNFPWPQGVTLRLPCANGRSLARYPDCIVLHIETLRAGFRLPLHPFICDILYDTKMCPAQSTPDSWRCIMAFLLKCKVLNLVPSYEAFKYMFKIHAFDLYGFFSQSWDLFRAAPYVKSWNEKWFLVFQSEKLPFNFPMYAGIGGVYQEEHKNVEDHVHEFIKVLKSTPPLYFDCPDIVYACALEEAGLSLPLPRSGQVGEVDLYKLYTGQKRRRAQLVCSSVESEHMESPRKNAKTLSSQLKDLDSTKPQKGLTVVYPVNAVAARSLSPAERVNINITWKPGVEEGNEVNQEGDAGVPSEGKRTLSFTRDSAEPSGIGALCREVPTALGRFPEIISAAQHLEELERQLKDSRQENVELKREKADLEQQLSASRRREVQLSEELAGKERVRI